MRLVLKGNLYLTAWKYAPKIPEPILRVVTNFAADIVWLKHGKGVKRLERNYAKVRPELSAKQIRKLSRKGMRSYLRYFREAFTLTAVSGDQLAARVRATGTEHVYNALGDPWQPNNSIGTRWQLGFSRSLGRSSSGRGVNCC